MCVCVRKRERERERENRDEKQGCQVQKKLKKTNLAMSSFREGQILKMKLSTTFGKGQKNGQLAKRQP